MSLVSRIAAAALAAIVLGAAAGPPAPARAAQADAGAPGAGPRRFTSDSDARKAVAVTVYNGGFGLVREVRDVTLAPGRAALEFRGVASTIQPETVAVESRTGGLAILEQNYRYDLLSPESLLAKYVGRRVTVHRWNEKLGREESQPAEVLSVNHGTVLRIGDEITFNYPGRLSFPEIPDNLIARPTLEWLLESRRAQQTLEVSYLAGGLGWQADYVMVLDPADTRAELTGWVTLRNESGAVYRDATLKLVAGDVRRAPRPGAPQTVQMRTLGYAAAEAQVREEELFEYHLYTLERPTTLLDNESKQVTLLEAAGVPVTRRYVLEGQPRWFRSQLPPGAAPEKVAVVLELRNEESAGLGVPLPKGVVRVYKADADGSRQFVGEDAIDHTPRDETVELQVGNAFDLVAERRQTDFRSLGKCTSESAFAIELRNRKDEDVTIEVLEHAGGDWELLDASREAEKEDAFSFRFHVPVPARGESTLEYTVRTRWC